MNTIETHGKIAILNNKNLKAVFLKNGNARTEKYNNGKEILWRGLMEMAELEDRAIETIQSENRDKWSQSWLSSRVVRVHLRDDVPGSDDVDSPPSRFSRVSFPRACMCVCVLPSALAVPPCCREWEFIGAQELWGLWAFLGNCFGFVFLTQRLSSFLL